MRSIEVQGTQVLLNGKPLYFKGFCKHEDFTAHGRGFDPVLNVKDVNLIHWANANAVRTSHYPYAEEFYDLCDREGILVMDETPAVGIGGGAAVNPYKEYPLAEHHRQVLAEMIHRDKNHPCVVLWSLGNEPDLEHFPQDAYDYWHPLYELAHQLDPQDRPVTLVCCQNDYTKDITTRTMDIVCINRYYGWYNLSGDMDAACYGLNQELDFWAEQHKPVMMSEYGADTVAGLHTAGAEMFSEEFQVEFYRRLDAEFDKRPWFVGEFVWNFADYDTVQGPMRVDGNKKVCSPGIAAPSWACTFCASGGQRYLRLDLRSNHDENLPEPRYDRRRGTAGTGRCLQTGGDQSAPVHLPVPEPFQCERYLPRLRQ